MTDTELFETLKTRLFTAVVGDVLDRMGCMRQFLPPEIRAIVPGTKLAGRAMPVLETDVHGDETGRGALAGRPFGLMFEALDDLKQGEVYIASGASPTYALFGELMSTRATLLGAAGAVVNGYARDLDGIRANDFPLFCFGGYAQDQGPRGKVVDYRCAIEVGGVRVAPGDVIFGDDEGVLVIPADAAQDVVAGALEKVETENAVYEAIKGGMSTAEAFRTFGVM